MLTGESLRSRSFVASLLHPVFFTSGAARNIEITYDKETGKSKVKRTKIIENYMSVSLGKEVFVQGAPAVSVSRRRVQVSLFKSHSLHYAKLFGKVNTDGYIRIHFIGLCRTCSPHSFVWVWLWMLWRSWRFRRRIKNRGRRRRPIIRSYPRSYFLGCADSNRPGNAIRRF